MNPTTTAPSPAPPWRGWAIVARCVTAVALSTFAVGCASLPANTARAHSSAFEAPGQTALGQLVQQRRTREHARSESGFHLLANVDEAFGSRLALIDAAQHTLDLQYYAIHADRSTEILLEALRNAARRGVRVRILMDDFNTVGKDAQVLRLAFEPNVQIRLFNPLPGSRRTLIGRIFTSLHDFDRIQKRMHNKLFIADNAIGITGGRNLGDAYFGADEKSNFVDTDILAAGTVVRQMSASFDRFWNDELAYPMQTLVSAEQLEELRKPPAPAAPDPAQAAQPVPVAAPIARTPTVLPVVPAKKPDTPQRRPMDLVHVALVWAPAAVLADSPGKIGPDEDEADAGETVVDGLLTLMQRAQHEILIVSPYFVPGRAMMQVFRDLHARGVRIRVLTNSLASTDAPAAHAGYVRYRKALLRDGVELHEMRATQEGSARGLGSTPLPGSGGGGSKSGISRASLHTKAVVIDRRLTVIGSMNLDLRSQRKNSEVALLIRSNRLSTQAQQQIDSTIASGAYQVRLDGSRLAWQAPPGAGFHSTHSEPDASRKLRLMLRLIAPFAPEEML